MKKEKFLKKHNFTEADWNNLVRFEKVRQGGSMNMFEYIAFMKKNNVNGGEKLAVWIMENYGEFLEVYKGGRK